MKMVTLEQWMKMVNYRITESSDFGWDCFGNTTICMDSWDGNHDGASATIVFDSKTQEVFLVEAHDYARKVSYRFIAPQHFETYKKHHPSEESFNMAYDLVNFIDLETEEDFLEKGTAIMNHEEYDDRIQVPLDLSDDLLFDAMKSAHERDITFNQYIEEVLRAVIAAKTGQLSPTE